jgi:WD40 repeat protein
VSPSPDGRWAAFVGRAWPLDAGSTAAAGGVPDLDSLGTSGAAFSADGALFALATTRGAELREAGDGRLVRVLGDEVRAFDVAFSPEGRALAAALADGSVRRWSLPDGRERRALRGHQGQVNAVAFAAGGRLIVSGGVDGRVLVWDPADDPEAGLIHPAIQPREVDAIAFDEDDRLVEVARDGQVLRLDPDTGALDDHRGLPQRVPWVSPGEPAALDETGRWLVAVHGGGDGLVRLWDLQEVRRAAEFATPSGAASCVAVAPGGGRVAIGTERGIQLHDIATGRSREVDAARGMRPFRLAFAPGSDRLAWSAGPRDPGVAQPSFVAIADAGTGAELRRFADPGGAMMGLSFSADGRHLAAVGFHDRAVRVWDAETGRLEVACEGPPMATDVAFSPDGRRLAVAGRSLVQLLDASSGELLLVLRGHSQKDLNTRGYNARVRFSHDGRRLAAVTDDMGDTVAVWSSVELSEPARLARWERGRFARPGPQLKLSGLRELTNPTSPEILLRAELALMHGAEGAREDFDRAIALRPDGVRGNVRFRDLPASLGRWSDSIEAYRNTLEALPGNLQVSFRLAVVQLLAGDVEGHRRTCVEAAQALPRARGGHPWCLALAWALPPGPHDDGESLERLVEAPSIQAGGGTSWRACTRALVDYRLGRPESALARLERLDEMEGADQEPPPHQASRVPLPREAWTPPTWPLRALALARLGRAEEARAALDRARAEADRLVVAGQNAWVYPAIYRLLLAEAEGAVKDPRPDHAR